MNLHQVGLSVLLFATAVHAQGDLKTIDEHVKAAETAAGQEYRPLFTQLCAPPTRGGGGGRGQQGPPERSTWYAEPVKVFDNLYFLGQSEYSVWAVTTSGRVCQVVEKRERVITSA